VLPQVVIGDWRRVNAQRLETSAGIAVTLFLKKERVSDQVFFEK